MDLIGPMPETQRGNKYIVTLTDYFTKWAEAAPLADKTALGVAKFIYSVSATENQHTIMIHFLAYLPFFFLLIFSDLGHV